MNNTTLNLFVTAVEMAENLNSLYSGKRFEKDNLLEFMDANEWFGATYSMKNKVPIIEARNFKKLDKPLTLWLSAYKKTGREKINLILNHFSEKYPVTCRLYQEFITREHLEDEAAAWKLSDYLFSEIDKEITDYGETDLDKLAKKMTADVTIQCARMFSDFLYTTKHNGRHLANWVYDFASRDRPEIINDAYSLDDFAVMAYCVFNEEMWVKQNLIEKAVRSSKYADLWIFVALHFICALRSVDMARLPAPTLPYDGGVVLKKISENAFGKHEASALVDELSIRLKLKPIKPSKTSAHENITTLKLFVPESLRVPLGLIMAIALAHHPEIAPGKCFVSPLDSRPIIRGFFGDSFIKALGKLHFSTRRCNKAYLQGIDTIASNDNIPGKPKGYILAALARSHKGGIGSLAKTTDIYLRDANFTGYTPEFIIREMFERGVFSFIPAVLLEMYTGSGYKALPVSGQTELINQLGLTAHKIEWTANVVEHALEKSRNAVTAILRDTANIRENVGGLLQNIASGNAPSRQSECLCLMTAAGLTCTCVDRNTCIGCGYEIYTKTAMHSLMKEYVRLVELKKSSTVSEAWRYGKILEQAVLPAVSEMITSMKLLYHGDGVNELLSIMEEGVKNADSGV